MFAVNGDLILKKALDDAIYPRVKTYAGKLPDLESAPREFCVYSVSSMPSQIYQDDGLVAGQDKIILRYYHTRSMNLKEVRAREREILNALLNAEFTCPGGAFELGDIDGIGYDTTGYELLFFSWRL